LENDEFGVEFIESRFIHTEDKVMEISSAEEGFQDYQRRGRLMGRKYSNDIRLIV
jgi:hypothetical protein